MKTANKAKREKVTAREVDETDNASGMGWKHFSKRRDIATDLRGAFDPTDQGSSTGMPRPVLDHEESEHHRSKTCPEGESKSGTKRLDHGGSSTVEAVGHRRAG